MSGSRAKHGPVVDSAAVGAAVVALLDSAAAIPADELANLVQAAGHAMGSTSARLLVADYGLISLRALGAPDDERVGDTTAIDLTVAGLAFSRAEVLVTDSRVFVPLVEGSERLGVLELTHPAWTEELSSALDPLVRTLVLLLVSRRRYTDELLRARRTEPLSLAAEIQWGLLPPLSCSTSRVSVSGILEPAYSIGGDSFDFALNADVAEFAIIDAVGHGMKAVLISTIAINGLRNARREGHGLAEAYTSTSDAITTQFGGADFATGQFGSLDLLSGQLTWLNAGHPLPLIIRDGHVLHELACQPSLPMGLGGTVAEIAVEPLHPGDSVLFYTDGVTETRSGAGTPFGLPRLADFLERATHQGAHPVETLRSLSRAITGHSDTGLSDDATLLMIEYHGP